MELIIGVGPEQDRFSWERRFREGEAEGPWIYGYDLLLKEFSGVSVALKPSSKIGYMLSAARSILHGAPRDYSGADRVALTWDEGLLAQSLADRRMRARNRVSGVIWATDRIHERGGSIVRAAIGPILSNADALFVLSTAQRQVLIEELRISPSAVRYIPFGVETDYFRYSEMPEGSRPLIFSVGRDRDRDPALLARIIEIVHNEEPDVQFLVQTRSPELMPEYVDARVSMTTREVRDAYREASLVLVATRPNLHVSGMTSVLQAMSCGRPVVLSNTPGAEDYVRHGSTGYLAEVLDAEQHAAYCLDLITDMALTKRMGKSGRKAVESEFSVGLLQRNIGDLVKSVADGES